MTIDWKKQKLAEIEDLLKMETNPENKKQLERDLENIKQLIFRCENHPEHWLNKKS